MANNGHGLNLAHACELGMISTFLEDCPFPPPPPKKRKKEKEDYMTETIWPTMPKIFTIQSFTEKVCQPLVYIN